MALRGDTTGPRSPAAPANGQGVLRDAELDDLARRVHAEVSSARAARRQGDAEAGLAWLDRDDLRQLTQALVGSSLAALTKERLGSGRPPLGADDEQRLVGAVQAMGGLGWAIEELMADPTVENININGPDAVFVHHSDGTKRRLARSIARSNEELERWVRNAAARLGVTERRFDEARPWLILRLPDGSRLFALMSVTPTGVCLSIRVHRYPEVDLDELRRLETMDRSTTEFVRAAVRARFNLIISGGTDVGKTTFCRACLNECPPDDRVITIEDSYELGLDQLSQRHPDVVALEAREPNVEGAGEITLRQLVWMALRMRPDRVVVGEVRGPEVLPMLHAMTQGNDGSMCTLHADSSDGVFERIAMYAAEAPERVEPGVTARRVAKAVDFIVHLDKDIDGADGRKVRYVSSIREVTGHHAEGISTNEIFRAGPDGRAVFGAHPLSARARERLEAVGWRPRGRSQP